MYVLCYYVLYICIPFEIHNTKYIRIYKYSHWPYFYLSKKRFTYLYTHHEIHKHNIECGMVDAFKWHWQINGNI